VLRCFLNQRFDSHTVQRKNIYHFWKQRSREKRDLLWTISGFKVFLASSENKRRTKLQRRQRPARTSVVDDATRPPPNSSPGEQQQQQQQRVYKKANERVKKKVKRER